LTPARPAGLLGALSLALTLGLACMACSESEPLPSFDMPAVGAPAREPLIRPDTPGNNLLFNFGASDVVETFGSTGGRFLVHFTKDGPHAVPLADGDASGVPDFVEQVASVYEEVLTKYQDELGFRAPVGDEGLPDNGGDGRFDVYLVDFNGQGDGHYSNDSCSAENKQICAGYMIQENDYKGYGYPSTMIANRILGSHEFFHAVQAAYDIDQGSVISEGSAVWATEAFDPGLKDFEAFLPGYLQNPDRPIDQPLPGAIDPFSYGAAIYFQFLTEHYAADTVRSLWERCENGANGVAEPYWFEQIEPLLAQKESVSFADAFTDFATWNLFTGKFADPTRSYASGAGYAAVSMSEVTAPYSDDALRVFYASAQYYRVNPEGRAEMTAALIAPDGAPEVLDGLRMMFTTRTGAMTAPVKSVVDVAAGTETIATSGVDKLVVVVVNGLTGGESRKPALCIGTVEEVAACREALAASPGSGGSGGSGGAGGTGGGGTGGGGGSAAEEPGGCGCRTVDSKGDPGALAALGALAAAVYLRRRRVRAIASASPAK